MNPQYQSQIYFYNFCNFSIGIACRDGQKFSVNRHVNTNQSGFGREPGVYVTTRDVYPPEAILAIASQSYQENEEASEALKIAIEHFTPKPTRPEVRNMPSSADGELNLLRFYSQAQVEDGRPKYNTDLDVVFIRLPNTYKAGELDQFIPDHPFSRKERMNQMINLLRNSENSPEAKRHFTQTMIHIGGANWPYKELYLRKITKDGKIKVETLVAENFLNMSAGLQIVQTTPSEHPGISNNRNSITCTTPEEFEKFDVFVTKGEALTPPSAILAKQEADRKLAQLMQTAELSEIKHAHELRTLELKNQQLDKDRIRQENEANQRERDIIQRERDRDRDAAQKERENLFNERRHERDIKQLLSENLLLKEKRIYEENKESKDRFGSILKWLGELFKSLGGLLTGLLGLAAIALKIFAKAPIPVV